MLLQRERPRTPYEMVEKIDMALADPAAALLDAIAAREAGFDPSDPAWRAGAVARAEQEIDRAVGPGGRRLALDALEHARGRAPAPLPSLRDALQRRAAVFGPVDPDEPPVRSPTLRQRLGAALRGLADLLEPAPMVAS